MARQPHPDVFNIPGNEKESAVRGGTAVFIKIHRKLQKKWGGFQLCNLLKLGLIFRFKRKQQ